MISFWQEAALLKEEMRTLWVRYYKQRDEVRTQMDIEYEELDEGLHLDPRLDKFMHSSFLEKERKSMISELEANSQRLGAILKSRKHWINMHGQDDLCPFEL